MRELENIMRELRELELMSLGFDSRIFSAPCVVLISFE